MSKEKRVKRIMKKIDTVMDDPSKFANPGLIISGLECLALKVELGE